MQEIPPEERSDRLQEGDGDPLVLDIRYEDDLEEWHIPDSIDVDVHDELADLEPGPSNCAAE